MNKTFFTLLIGSAILAFVFGCQEKTKTPEINAQTIVDKAIEKAGGAKYTSATMSFNFRDLSYKNTYKNGRYSLERTREDSTGLTTDVIDNQGFRRLVNGKLVVVADTMAVKYTNSVNSVHYFARLPYGLNDAAVQKKLIGTDTILGKAYYEIEVKFKQEGGGVDFQDVFMYWFDTQDYSLDYLAYSYETDGGGVRFREANNIRQIEGISFADYINYKPPSIDVSLSQLDDMFIEGTLKEVSKIELKNIKVTINN